MRSFFFNQNKLEFKSFINRTLKVRLCLPAQEAVAGQTISVSLGQHGIKTNDFIKQFNEQTKCYPKGQALSSLIFIQKDGTFKFKIKGVNSLFLIKNFAEKKHIDLKDLYLIALLLKKTHSDLKNVTILSLLKSLKGSLYSGQILLKNA